MDLPVLIQSLQYLLPVTIAILGLSIFLFGFQSVKEPDYSYINHIVTTRKKKQQPVKKNGVVTAPKPTTPVIVKAKVEAAPKPAPANAGKENTQPKKVKKPVQVDESADLEQGDWLPAPVRGASNRKAAAAAVVKQQTSPKKTNAKVSDSPVAAKKKQAVLKEVQNKLTPIAAEVEKKADAVAQKNVLKEAQSAASEKSSASLVLEETTTAVEIVADAASAEGESKQAQKKAASEKKAAEGGVPDSPDLWEESKSRGNKKKARARKD